MGLLPLAIIVRKLLVGPLMLGLLWAGTCYQVQAVDPSLPLVTGAFVQLHGGLASKSSNWWQTELDSMSAVGMDTLVIQYVAYDNSYFYPTNVPGGSSSGTDSIERILDAADANNIDVFLGVHLDSTPDSNNTFNLTANLAQGQATLSELDSRYASHASLAGWYMPQEISDYIVFNEPQLRDNLLSYTNSLKTQVSGFSSDLPMMISPYFGQTPNAAAYAAWWDTTGLPQTGVDIVAMQDGVGTHRTTIAEARPVFEAIQPVMANHNVAFWANNESFDQTHGWPIDEQPWASVPADINTFTQQIQSTTPLVDKSITFEFTSYMSTQGSSAANTLYQDYQAYFQSVPVPSTQQIAIASYAYENPAGTAFNASAGDPGNSLLIDGETGTTDSGAGNAFADGTWVGLSNDTSDGGPQPRVVFDLGGEFQLDSVELFYLVDASSFIFSPQEIAGIADALTIKTSTDGTTFTEAASSNSFVPWADDQTASAFEKRSIVLDLNGVTASHLAIDVRTPNTWVFLGELQVFAAGSPADFDNDGDVDDDDLLLWQNNFGSASSTGDADADGDVDGADFLAWQRDFTSLSTAVQAAQTVPEPSTIVLLGFSTMLLFSLKRTIG